ncbi:MAG: hydrolase [Candidatus Marinimicrobia bacterium]|nr:hydrolase [Candidatus Neomarinimicrobiota bacterium]
MMLAAADSVLVLVDVQGRLAEAMPEPERLFQRCGLLLQAAARLDVPVWVTEQVPEKLGPTHAALLAWVKDTPRWAKSTFSCCGAPGFAEALAVTSRRQLVLCGIEAHVCVTQTALELRAAGREPWVVADAVGPRAAAAREIALGRLARAGVGLLGAESVLFEWLRDARHPAFRELARLLR